MRVLDLGAHDGFVGTWLAQQVEGLHIDGVEANSEGVRRANERAKKHGIAGEYKQGLAEDAESLFPYGFYDAVVAFELIEHVVDVDRFLEVCELMLRPGGRIYLSTPNGTFGEGHNPHHLRVYRAVDLFELCRRRGEVCNMVAGNDGVTVISYEPSNRSRAGEVAIYCGPGWEKWHPGDIGRKGLGGSETAAVKLSEALSDEGYVVTVYGECDHCAWRQVSFKPHHTFDPLDPRKAVIVSRRPDLADRPINAEKKLLWVHDTDYGPLVTEERIDRFDSVLVLSQWHREHWEQRYPFSESKLRVFGNAIEPRYFEGPVELDRPPVALYSSSPDRGLDKLLWLWPIVREQIPDAELHYCYASVYDAIADKNPEVARFRSDIERLSSQPGVVNLGSLSQPEVAKKMREVSTWLAPSWNTPSDSPFYETYCIGAQEAAAAGAHVVAADWGALPERMDDAVYSFALPNNDVDEWVRAIVNSMQLDDYQASPTALATTWSMRAKQIAGAIEGALATV